MITQFEAYMDLDNGQDYGVFDRAAQFIAKSWRCIFITVSVAAIALFAVTCHHTPPPAALVPSYAEVKMLCVDGLIQILDHPVHKR